MCLLQVMHGVGCYYFRFLTRTSASYYFQEVENFKILFISRTLSILAKAM